MVARVSLLVSALVVLGSAPAMSQGAPQAPAEGGEPGYCRWVRGRAASEAALLQAPELFGRGGLVNVSELEDGAGGVPLGLNAWRITAGASYSASNLWQGATLRRRADAECERYRAHVVLERMVRAGAGDIGAREALEARAALLAELLPQGESRVAATREEVKQGRATLEELNALQLRLDGLRALAHQTEAERQRLAGEPVAEGRTLSELLSRLAAADAEVEQHSSALRRMEGWDVSVRGGYDQLLGADQQRLPVFGLLSVTYNLGHLFQGGAEAEAQEGRRAFLSEDVDGMDVRIGSLLRELRAAHQTERNRLEEVGVLIRDLAQQLESFAQLETAQVRRYRDTLWFELARLRAEEAWLRAHVQALDAFVGERQP